MNILNIIFRKKCEKAIKKSEKDVPKNECLKSQRVIEENLYGSNEALYGTNLYKEHLLEQYKLYVEMADNTSDKRAITNGFFLTLHTLLGTAFVIMKELILDRYILIPIAFIGLFISIVWYYLIKTYRNLNTAKFEVINKIEEGLPIKGFTTEWKLLLNKHKHYKGFTKLEQFVPCIVGCFYIILTLFSFCFVW